MHCVIFIQARKTGISALTPY